MLEDDIALANTALDLIGQTQLGLGHAGEVEGKGRYADRLACHRDAAQFRNLLLVERPYGDLGQTLMRQFLFDAWHMEMLRALQGPQICGWPRLRPRRQGKWPITWNGLSIW